MFDCPSVRGKHSHGKTNASWSFIFTQNDLYFSAQVKFKFQPDRSINTGDINELPDLTRI